MMEKEQIKEFIKKKGKQILLGKIGGLIMIKLYY